MAVGDPTGGDLCSVTVDISTLPLTPSTARTTFTLGSSASIVSGNHYAIVIGPIDIDVTEYIQWGQVDTVGAYVGGFKCISSDSGSTWTQVTDADCDFTTRASGVDKDEYLASFSWQACYGSYYIAQTFKASSSYDIDQVILRLRRAFPGATGSVKVSIRNVESETATKPTNPTPANSATGVDFSGFTLSWDGGGTTDDYDVYIGPSGSLTQVSDAQEGTSYVTSLAEIESIFGVSPINQKIYWRVDANVGEDTAIGDEWNFDARPTTVSTVSPTNETTGVSLDAVTVGWDEPSSNTDHYEVWSGVLSGLLSKLGETSDLGYDLYDYTLPSYGKAYYWKVKAVNDFGTTDGSEVYFTSLIFSPPLSSGLSLDSEEGGNPDDDPTPTGTLSGENNMSTIKRLIIASRNTIFYEDI